MSKKPDDHLRLGDAAAIARVSQEAMKLAIDAGDLEAQRDGQRVLVREVDLQVWMHRHDLPRTEPA